MVIAPLSLLQSVTLVEETPSMVGGVFQVTVLLSLKLKAEQAPLPDTVKVASICPEPLAGVKVAVGAEPPWFQVPADGSRFDHE